MRCQHWGPDRRRGDPYCQCESREVTELSRHPTGKGVRIYYRCAKGHEFSVDVKP